MNEALSRALIDSFPFVSSLGWDSTRPHILVVACSDGRLQRNLDEFLSRSLQIVQYDRLYLPGGPGALASSGTEYMRAERHCQELVFLVDAHQLETIILLFHGPAPDGPVEALCADYVRIMGAFDPAKIDQAQRRDYAELKTYLLGRRAHLRVLGYRCEVHSDSSVRFVSLDGEDS